MILVPPGYGLVHGTMRTADGSPSSVGPGAGLERGIFRSGNTDADGRFAIVVPQGVYQYLVIGGTDENRLVVMGP